MPEFRAVGTGGLVFGIFAAFGLLAVLFTAQPLSSTASGEPTELYFRPESRVYRPAGHYQPSSGKYPVDKSALLDYLRHQSNSHIQDLNKWQSTTETSANQRESSSVSRGKGRRLRQAVDAYLKHQKPSLIESRLRSQKVRALRVEQQASHTRVQQLANRILGSPRPHASAVPQGTQSSTGDAGSTATGAAEPATNGKNLLNVVSMLQKEIALDTDAIKEFRTEVTKATANPESKQQALEALRPKIAALRQRNEKLASDVAKVGNQASKSQS